VGEGEWLCGIVTIALRHAQHGSLRPRPDSETCDHGIETIETEANVTSLLLTALSQAVGPHNLSHF